MRCRAAVLLSLALTSAACGPEAAVPEPDPPVPLGAEAALELMYLVRGPDARVRFGGLVGALPPDAQGWDLEVPGQAPHPIQPDARGGFELELGPLELDSGLLRRRGQAVQRFRLRDAELARKAAVWPPLGGAGSVPNDLVFAGEGEEARLVLVRSGDHAISVLDLELGLDAGTGLRLPERDAPRGPMGAQPWFAAPFPDGERVAVSAFLQARVYVAHLPSLSIEATFEPLAPVELPAPLLLPYALDLDGDGRAESSVTRFTPRSPQGVYVHGERLFVAYSGFVAPRLSADRPPVYLPGVLLSFSLRDPGRAPQSLVLPYQNPQWIGAAGGSDRLLVVSSGVLDADPEVHAVTAGGVMIVNPASLEIEQSVDLGARAPGSALLEDGVLWIASLVRPEVWRVPVEGGEPTRFSLNDDPVDSVFRLVLLPGGLIGAPSFNTDRLHLIDPRRGRLDPSPFFGPLELGPGRPIFDGLQVIARRPGRGGVDFVGPDLYALSGVASRVVPVELRKVLGP